MAKVYPVVNGMKIEEYMARNKGTQAALRIHATTSRTRANMLLSEHRWDGDSWVTADKGDIDWYVTLHDRGNSRWPQAGAMSIEYGREPGTRSPWGPMEGLYILHRATGARTAVRGFKKIRLKVKVPGRGRAYIKYG